MKKLISFKMFCKHCTHRIQSVNCYVCLWDIKDRFCTKLSCPVWKRLGLVTQRKVKNDEK